MMIIRKNTILIISLISSILGLILIYISSINAKPSYMAIKDINLNLVGRTISTSGYITDVQFSPKGHIFLKIKDENHEVSVVIFSDLAKALSDFGIHARNFTKGKIINVTGTLDIYNNNFQIIPRKVDDLKIR